MSADSSPPSDGEPTPLKDEQPPDRTATASRDSSVVVDPRKVTVSIAEESSLEAKSVAMEIDEAFQADPSGFAMSFEELSAENQSEQLYEELTRSPERNEISDNQLEHGKPAPNSGEPPAVEAPLAATTQPSQEVSPAQEPVAMKQENTAQVVPTETKPATERPAPATRKSPRRTAEPKPASNKRAATGTKRASAAATASHAFSWNDILRVQNLIERCLQQYLSKNEIVLTLKAQADVDPSFTAVVWQKLEEQNPTFFKAYNLQLKLKDQITAYNYLVSQQKEMMAKASGSAAFMSFLSSTESRNAQRQGLTNNVRASRLAATAQARARSSAVQASTTTTNTTTGFASTSSQGFPPPSPLPLPSPIKTDLDTHAFFS